MKKKTGQILKEIRENKGLEAKDVVEMLEKEGFKRSRQALYNYESGIRSMDIELFMAFCKIYNIKNVLETFSDVELEYNVPNDEEWTLIEQFRNLDSYGNKAVKSILSIEEERCKESVETIVYMRPVGYYQRSVSAGTGLVLLDGIPVDTINIPITEEYKNVAYAVGVNGSSMEPLYHDNDVLLVEAVSDIRTGDIGIFYISGEAYVKKLGESALISLNQGYDPIPLTEETQCKGRVIDAIRKDL